MYTNEKKILKLDINESTFVKAKENQEKPLQTVEFEILPPVDVSDVRKAEIYKEISDIDERLDFISKRVEELNSEIDTLTNHADGFDYAVAVISGVLAGLIDSFFVGETKIDKEKIREFLEKKYHTANDSGYKHKDADGHWTSSAMYHRLDDLAHHPSVTGLIASVLVRYFRLVVFIDGSDGNPHIFFADTSNIEVTMLEKEEQIKAWIGAVIGGLCVWASDIAIKNYEEKSCEELPKPLKKLIKIVGVSPLMLEIFKAVDVWVGHIMSDVSTSQGIPGIFLSLLKEISVLPTIRDTDFRVWADGLYNKGEMNLSKWGGVVFTAAKTQALPILINEIFVRGFYFIKHLAEELKDKEDFKQVDWNKVIPFKNRTVERMLTVSTGTLTAIDIIDATIRSGGFNASCILRVNFVGIGRFAVALGTDVAMGVKKAKKENERTRLRSEELNLLNAKVFYKQADMWIEAENTQEKIDEAYESMETAVNEFFNAWEETKKDIKIITGEVDLLKEKDRNLANELSDILEWGS